MTHRVGQNLRPLDIQVILGMHLQKMEDDTNRTRSQTQNETELEKAQEAVMKAKTNIDQFGKKKESVEEGTVSPNQSKADNKWTQMTKKIDGARDVNQIMHRCYC